MKSLVLIFLIQFALNSAYCQVVKGGIDPDNKHREGAEIENKRTPGGGVTLDLIRDLEKKIELFNKHFHIRHKKCVGIDITFKNFSETVVYLNLKFESEKENTIQANVCERSKIHKCLIDKKATKLLKAVSEHKVLEHYLIEHEDFMPEEFEQFRTNLKKHYGK